MTTYVCKQRVVALLLMELLSKMRKMRTITPLDAIVFKNIRIYETYVTYKRKPITCHQLASYDE